EQIQPDVNQPVLTPLTVESLPTIQTPSIIQETPEWMTYDGLDLSDQKTKVTVHLTCENKEIHLPEFTIHVWYDRVFEDGTFAIGENTVVAWEHLGYYGLSMHSGQDSLGRKLTAF